MRLTQRLEAFCLSLMFGFVTAAVPATAQGGHASLRDVLRKSGDELPAAPAGDAGKSGGQIYVFGNYHPAPAGANLVTVPVLSPGRPAWVSVLSGSGHPIPDVSVLVDGVPFSTDRVGAATLQIPKAQSVELAIIDADKRVVDHRNYFITGSGFLVADGGSIEVYSMLDEMVPRKGAGPVISYAPLAIQPREPLVVFGRNFTAKPNEDELVVDGLDATVLSGSPVCLLATAPPRVSIGPVREMFVRAGDDSSTVREVDICKVEFTCRQKELKPGVAYRAKVQVIGTNLPCLVGLDNSSPEVVHIVDRSGQPVPKQAKFISSGGEQNVVPLTITLENTEPFVVDAHLLPDIPGAPEAENLAKDETYQGLVREASKGEITRLKRRLISVENRLLQLKQKGDLQGAEGAGSDEELERINAELKQTSNRQARLLAMLNCRRALLESFGGSEEDYQRSIQLAVYPSVEGAEEAAGQGLVMATPGKLPGAAAPRAQGAEQPGGPSMKILAPKDAEKAAQEEAAKKAGAEAALKKATEEALRKAAAEEAARKAAAEEAAKKAAEEAARKAAAEEAARKAAAEAAAKKAAEEAARKAAAEEAARKAAAEAAAKKAAEEAAKKAAAEEAARKAAAEAAAKKAAEEAARKAAAEEAARKAAEAAAAKKAAEEAARKAAAEEAARKAAEEAAKKAAAEEAARKAAAEEAARKAAAEAAAKKAAEEAARKAAAEEAARKAVEEAAAKKAAEEAAKKAAAEEAARKAAEEAAAKEAAEEAAKKAAGGEAAKKAAAEAAARQAAAEAAAKKAAEEAATQAAAEEAARKAAAEEATLKAAAEIAASTRSGGSSTIETAMLPPTTIETTPVQKVSESIQAATDTAEFWAQREQQCAERDATELELAEKVAMERATGQPSARR